MATGKFLPEFAEGQSRMTKEEEAPLFLFFYALFIMLCPN